MRRRTIVEWKKVIEEWQTSGLKITPWSKKHQIPVNTIRYWRDYFTTLSRSSFVELKESPQEKPIKISSSGVHLVCKNIKIDLDHDFDITALEKCITLLKGLRC